MLFIVLGVIGSVYIRRKLEDDYFTFATFLSMVILFLGIIIGLFAPIFYGNQEIVNSAELLPVYNDDVYLIIQNNIYHFEADSKDMIWKNGTLANAPAEPEIRITNSFLNQVHYCIEYPRHDIWLLSFELLPVPRHYYEFCISNNSILK